MKKLGMLLLLSVLAGCSKPSAETDASKPETEATKDVELGTEAVANETEERRVESETGGDYDKMTEAESPDAAFEKSISEFDEAINADPDSPDVWFRRGMDYLEHGKNEKAIGDFDEVIKLDPKNAEAYLMRSRAYGSAGDSDRAQSDRARALELDPNVEQ